MHCTNGILIQWKSHNHQTSERADLNIPLHKKRKSFTPVESELAPYLPSLRIHPHTKKCDMIWVLLHREYIIKNREQAVPCWNGFYHEVMEDRESPVHEVHYLRITYEIQHSTTYANRRRGKG